MREFFVLFISFPLHHPFIVPSTHHSSFLMYLDRRRRPSAIISISISSFLSIRHHHVCFCSSWHVSPLFKSPHDGRQDRWPTHSTPMLRVARSADFLTDGNKTTHSTRPRPEGKKHLFVWWHFQKAHIAMRMHVISSEVYLTHSMLTVTLAASLLTCTCGLHSVAYVTLRSYYSKW